DELVTGVKTSALPTSPFPGLSPGRVGLKQAFEMFWNGTPGHHVIEDQIAEGDKVVTRLRGIGRHEGELAGIPASGNALDVKAVEIGRASGRGGLGGEG